MCKFSLFESRRLFFVTISFILLSILGVSVDVHANSVRTEVLNQIKDSGTQEETFDSSLFATKLKTRNLNALIDTKEALLSQAPDAFCSSYTPSHSDPVDWEELAWLVDSDYNTDEYAYWWICRVPYDATYSYWFYEDVLPDDVLNYSGNVFEMLMSDAIPNKIAEGIYLSDYFDILVPSGSTWGAGLYHLAFWDFYANNPGLAGGFYFSKLWDTTVPNKWANAYYYKTLFDEAIPKKWTNGYWHRVFWDKAIPYKYKNAYYLKLFWDNMVPGKWASGYYAKTFWGSTVTQRWASGYYRNTLVYSARPDKWAGGYYLRYFDIR